MRIPLITAAVGALLAVPVAAQDAGEQLFNNVCSTCHGDDGRGVPGFQNLDIQPPDFTDCSFQYREPDQDFMAVATGGGPARGFSELMPAHGTAFDQETIRLAVAYIRSLCEDHSWPRGELNLPRPLVTEKAFPEDEAVITTTYGLEDGNSVGNEFLYEKRFGPRSQVELKLPYTFREDVTGAWGSGFGDLTVGLKHNVFHSLPSGSILSFGGEVKMPTGSTTDGLGGGTWVLEPFASFGQLLPANAFLHLQALAEFKTASTADHEAQLRGVLGRTFTSGQYGRAWSPMIEAVGVAEFVSGSTEYNLDLIPQLQVTLNRRQHIMLNAGVRFPITDASQRETRLMVYLLWDWYDGGFFQGW